MDFDNTYGAGAGAEIRRTDATRSVLLKEGEVFKPKENVKANTIKITPEMREKVLKEGVHTFASGGVIGNLPSRLAKI